MSSRRTDLEDLRGRVAIVTGGSRGIGREVCLALARQGCHIVIAAKTVTPHPTLPGTIHTVAAEVEAVGRSLGNGARALAHQTDIRSEAAVNACAAAAVARFGRVDILINNASALWWQNLLDTPAKRYDLIHSINVRGSFLMAKACLPHMVKGGFGRVVCMSPPISAAAGVFAGRTMYSSTKMGMTMVALGVAEEFEGQNITGNSLWPATIIESLASINFKMGTPAMWRKATIIADATVGICREPGSFSGHMLIDDEYLRARMGFGDDDFVQYRCDPEVEPARILAAEGGGMPGAGVGSAGGGFFRGSVTRLGNDQQRSGEFEDALKQEADQQRSKL